MTDYPMIYSAPMVRALQAGIKTQTRRLSGLDDVNKNPGAWSLHSVGPLEYMAKPSVKGRFGATFESRDIEPGTLYVCPQVSRCAPGDRLWVKEAWRTEPKNDDLPPSGLDPATAVVWFDVSSDWQYDYEKPRYRHARFMPRWASRITLTVTEVRPQRVSEISEDDAKAEGVRPAFSYPGWDDVSSVPRYRWGFHEIWNSIHGPDAWARNDWVWAYSFSVHHGNIDIMERRG
jgi:hypothetical protein